MLAADRSQGHSSLPSILVDAGSGDGCGGNLGAYHGDCVEESCRMKIGGQESERGQERLRAIEVAVDFASWSGDILALEILGALAGLRMTLDDAG
jgi:hypothetical protein